jgi:hypothetical protein
MSCSAGEGGGLPLQIGKYKIYAECIFINTKIYKKNDIILVKNGDTWFSPELDSGEMLIYKCLQTMTAEVIYPASNSLNKPPTPNVDHNASNIFWQQLTTRQLQEIISNSQSLWFLFMVCLIIIFFLFNRKN